MFGVKLLVSLSRNQRKDAGLAVYRTLYKDYAKNHDTLFSRRISEIEAFNKLILDLANIDIEIKDEDPTLMLLTSLPSSYENFVETLLYGRESLKMEDVLATLNSRELKKRTKGTKEEAGDGLYVRERSDHSCKAHSGGSSRFKSRGGTSKLMCFICHLKVHLKRDSLMKKSSGFVKKGKRNQDSNSSDEEGNAYFEEALVVVRNDEMIELVMDSGRSYHMTHMMDFLYDFKVFDSGSVQLDDNRTCAIKGIRKMKIHLHDGSRFILENVSYVPGLRRILISLGTLEKEGYTVKLQMGRIKVINGSRVMMTEIWKKNCVYTLEAKVMTFGVQKHEVAQRQLEDKQLEEKTNMDCLVKDQEKKHLGIKVGANITVTGVPEQEGAEGNVAEKKKVKKSMRANLGKLLKSVRTLPFAYDPEVERSARLRRKAVRQFSTNLDFAGLKELFTKMSNDDATGAESPPRGVDSYYKPGNFEDPLPIVYPAVDNGAIHIRLITPLRMGELSKKVDLLLRNIRKGVPNTSHVSHNACSLCGDPSYSVNNYQSWEAPSNEEVNVVYGNHPQNDPFSKSYNLGWRNHPNFRWKDDDNRPNNTQQQNHGYKPRYEGGDSSNLQQNYQQQSSYQQRPQQYQNHGQSSSNGQRSNTDQKFDLILSELAKSNQGANLKFESLSKSVVNLERQMRQLAREVHKRESGKLPSYLDLNPKHKPGGPEHVNKDFVTDDEIVVEGKKDDNMKSDSELVNDLLKYFPKPPTQNPKATELPKVREGGVKLRLNVFNSLNSPILNDCYHIDTIDECIQTHTPSMNLDRTLENLHYVDSEKELFDGMTLHEKEDEFQMIEE
uniref:Zinc finger, CCHC-type n=1 Tax=Tanacetum cinerariifolium TaxID=118510 RepID=A0A6L2JCE6_TANCI|nr:zinc finger, CCHC-type [Tanacetum cinerariifolium]